MIEKRKYEMGQETLEEERRRVKEEVEGKERELQRQKEIFDNVNSSF